MTPHPPHPAGTVGGVTAEQPVGPGAVAPPGAGPARRPEHDSLEVLLARALELVRRWESGFGPHPDPPVLRPDPDLLEGAWRELEERMQGNHPFFHPRFAGQMLEAPHPVAAAAYLAAMLVNPNNHALDGGPVTSGMELEAVADLARMLDLPAGHLGHLTSGGTVANLEALWVARELRPGTRVLHGADAHYTHGRMCGLLGVAATAVPSDPTGHLDLEAAEAECRKGDVGALVVTAGTTGLGSVDDIAGALELRDRYGVRVHVDAAYGGFFALLAGTGALDSRVDAAFRAIGRADSVVVDPHKHGLQPYGCGAVLFADPGVARIYEHDSPYTYFSSAGRHLGEVTLECSRAGAAAAALWFTLRVLPLAPDRGIGPILAAGRRAAKDLAGRLAESRHLRLHVTPELDIVTYFAARRDGARGPGSLSVTESSERILALGMRGPDRLWLSTLRVDPRSFAARHPDLPAAQAPVTVLRSVLMKSSHEAWAARIHERLEALAGAP